MAHIYIYALPVEYLEGSEYVIFTPNLPAHSGHLQQHTQICFTSGKVWNKKGL